MTGRWFGPQIDNSCCAAGSAAIWAGDVTVRVQAGMEGVGFDQLVLSPSKFLEKAPSESVVAKPR